MSLLCTPSVVPPSPSSAETAIANDGWFPSVSPAGLRAVVRAGTSISVPRLREAALAAIVTVNNDLAAWKEARLVEGRVTFAAVPSPLVDAGKTRLVFLYERAIACLVRAELAERQREPDTTGAGAARADLGEQTVDELRRDARHAVRDILGTTRTFAELI